MSDDPLEKDKSQLTDYNLSLRNKNITIWEHCSSSHRSDERKRNSTEVRNENKLGELFFNGEKKFDKKGKKLYNNHEHLPVSEHRN
jgi:hypothetical protein